ncbi:hypothetical protein Q4E40_13040 [Pontibacter sp. BT731]|uniref:hypothetical protein n=1 Tax=Pontibacter coccineus TaxID=3063328 RepID=UPI0026E20ECC|nr:hypothetical protein [Pontibacter sp. BT731]MDO6391061.1 hypothetical protein [Pontibacter sp. BT731]
MNTFQNLGKIILVVFVALLATPSFAQNDPVTGRDQTYQAAERHVFKHWRVAAVMYHTYIGTRTSEGKRTLIVPSLGLDLEYWFNEKWGIGSHNDLELVSFEVEREEEVFIERETPVLFTLDALWKPWKELVVMAGPGIEIEPKENLFVFRVGLEYEIEIGSHWDVAPTIFYDSRTDAYDTFSMGLGIGKRF